MFPVNYMAYRISVGALNYTEVVTKYPNEKGSIDDRLIEMGYGDLIE